MTPTHDPGTEDHDQRAARILRAIEELRLLVEDLLDRTRTSPAAAERVWLVRDCEDLVACCDTEDEAVEARADLQHRRDCDYGPDPDLRESITITPVLVEPVHLARTGHAG